VGVEGETACVFSNNYMMNKEEKEGAVQKHGFWVGQETGGEKELGYRVLECKVLIRET